jgi:hypothetical protein
MASVLQEILGVQTHDASLIRLCNISEDTVHHTAQHAVLQRVSGILNDRDDVGALFGNVDEITTRAGGELDGVNTTILSYDIGAVGHGGSRSGTEVQQLGPWAKMN